MIGINSNRGIVIITTIIIVIIIIIMCPPFLCRAGPSLLTQLHQLAELEAEVGREEAILAATIAEVRNTNQEEQGGGNERERERGAVIGALLWKPVD